MEVAWNERRKQISGYNHLPTTFLVLLGSVSGPTGIAHTKLATAPASSVKRGGATS